MPHEGRTVILLDSGECAHVDDLSAQVALFERIYNFTPVMMHSIDASGRLVRVSDFWLQKLGYERDEVLGLRSTDFLSAESRQRALSVYLPLFYEQGYLRNVEYQFVRKDGQLLDVLLSAAAMRDPDGSIAQSLAVSSDVTDLRRVEQSLRESESRLLAILRSAHDAIVGFDNDGRIVLFNAAAVLLFGRSAEEAIGLRLAELVEGPAPLPCPVGEGVRLDLVLIARDGRRVPVDASFSSSWSCGQALTTAVLRDCSARRELEENLRNAKEAAESSAAAKSRFLAMMSHEIRTPMNAILGMAHLLLDSDLSPNQARYAKTLRASSEALLALLNDALDFSKLEAGRLELESICFETRTCVEEVIELFSQQASSKGITLDAKVSHHVPRMARGDAMRLRQILVNLVGNAVKFTHQGGITLFVDAVESLTVDGAPPHHDNAWGNPMELRVSVLDSGIGVPPESESRLFQLFSQVDASTTRQYGGTGLGLAISQRLVELMGGSIHFKRPVEGGSRFDFSVHLMACHETAPCGTPNRPLNPELGVRLPLRILLAEDNPVNQQLTQLLTQKMGYVIDVVNNGAEALAAVRSQAYDLVLMDVQMPCMDGLEAARHMRADANISRRLVLVALTASTSPTDRIACLTAGMNDYLSKPLRPESLQERLEYWAEELLADVGER